MKCGKELMCKPGLGGPGVIIINGASVIANAETEVHIQNTTGNYADFEIYDDVLFCNNYRGMRIEGYGSAHPGLIEEMKIIIRDCKGCICATATANGNAQLHVGLLSSGVYSVTAIGMQTGKINHEKFVKLYAAENY